MARPRGGCHALIEYGDADTVDPIICQVFGDTELSASRAALIVRAVNQFDSIVEKLKHLRKEWSTSAAASRASADEFHHGRGNAMIDCSFALGEIIDTLTEN